MAPSIAHFVTFEIGSILSVLRRLGFLATLWSCAPIAVVGMVIIIYVAAEVIAAMEPRTGADEDPAGKPFRTVVAGGGTAIGGSVIVPIRTFRDDSDVDADLSLHFGGGHREADCSHTG
jgi:uncharacterized membrane protein